MEHSVITVMYVGHSVMYSLWDILCCMWPKRRGYPLTLVKGNSKLISLRCVPRISEFLKYGIIGINTVFS